MIVRDTFWISVTCICFVVIGCDAIQIRIRDRHGPRHHVRGSSPERVAKSNGYSSLLQTYINQLRPLSVTAPPPSSLQQPLPHRLPQPLPQQQMFYTVSYRPRIMYQPVIRLRPSISYMPAPVTYHQPIRVQPVYPRLPLPPPPQPPPPPPPTVVRPQVIIGPPSYQTNQQPSYNYQEPLMMTSYPSTNQRHVPHNAGHKRPEHNSDYKPQQHKSKQRKKNNKHKHQSYGEDDHGYHDDDRGYHDDDRSYHDDDRGYHDDDRRYHDDDRGYHDDDRDGYDNGHDGYDDDHDRYDDYHDDHGGYGKNKRPKKEFVPVYKPRKKKSKTKIVSIMPGFYVAGGTQIFGKYKSAKVCQKACGATPSCFAGDYNPWLKKCYLHTNLTACSSLRAHKKLIHFKKIPCEVPEAPMGLITLGAQLFKAIEQKGIKSLADCLKRCAVAGTGIPLQVANIGEQLCFGIDYDFGSHKCYFHVDNTLFRICPADGSQPLTPRDLVANPAVVNILLCPGP